MKKKNLLLSFAFVLPLVTLFFFISSRDLSSQTVYSIGLPLVKDNTLYESTGGDISNGAGQYMFAGKTASGQIRRALIMSDLTKYIPKCAMVISTSVSMYLSRTISGPETIELKKVLQNWGEGTSQGSGEEGQGAPATTGDATWLNTFYNTSNWSTTGGTFAPVTSGSLSVDAAGEYVWDGTTQMVADVQGWVSDPSTNFGWALIGNESTIATVKRFNSRTNASVGLRPVISVSYYVPLTTAALRLTYLMEGFWNGTDLVSDTVRVFLRSSSAPYGIIDSAKGVIRPDGDINLCFQTAATGNYYIVANHRNTMTIWSADPQVITQGDIAEYDFSNISGNTYGLNVLSKLGRLCAYSGDVIRDDNINLADIVKVFNDASAFTSGYVISDVNGSNNTNLADIVITANNASKFVSLKRP